MYTHLSFEGGGMVAPQKNSQIFLWYCCNSWYDSKLSEDNS